MEDLLGEPVSLEQMPKLQQCRCVGRRLQVQVDADETMNGPAVVDRILSTFVRQTTALLGYVHTQDARKTNRRTASTLGLRVKRFDFLM